MQPPRATSSLSSLNALLPGTPATFPSAKGTLYVWEGVPRVLVSCVVGRLSVESAQALDTASRRVVARSGALHAFHAWEAMTDYDSEARARLTQAGLDLMSQTESIHVLAKSMIVRLGVQAASLVLRKIRMHDEYRTFEDALRHAMREKAHA